MQFTTTQGLMILVFLAQIMAHMKSAISMENLLMVLWPIATMIVLIPTEGMPLKGTPLV